MKTIFMPWLSWLPVVVLKKSMYTPFLDGRDTPPRSAESSLEKLDALLKEKGIGRVASLIGRYFAMDRDNRWDRVQQAYDLITDGKAEFSAATAVEGLKAAYERDENDEFVKATVIGAEAARLNDGDALVIYELPC